MEKGISKEFEEIYQELYNKYIHKTERMRKNVKLGMIIQSILIVIVYIQIENFGIQNSIINGKIALISILILLILLYFNSRSASKYKEIYKNVIMPNFIKSINTNLEYKPTSSELDYMYKEYKNANFDGKHVTNFYPDDYIEGFLYNDIFVKMVNLGVEVNTGSGKSRYIEELFKGIFLHIKYGKNIETHIKISKNANKIFVDKEKVEMDSSEFEKYFDVYAEDKIIAMQLLTSDTMMLLMDFYNKYKIDYEIVIKNNNVYMRFFTGSMFEPKIFGKSIDKDLLSQYYCIFEFINNITREFGKALKEI